MIKRAMLLAVAPLVLGLAGCENVPDYLVEGRLPFGKQPVETARQETPPPAPVAQPAPEARPEKAKSGGWHLWPHKDKDTSTEVAAAAPLPAQTAPAAEPATPPTPTRQAPVPPPQVAMAAPALEPDRPEATPPLAGGFQRATDKAGVDAAAAFAVHESPLYELKGIKSAWTQVVAGTNYELCLKVRQVDHEANPFHIRLVEARVFRGLDGHYELASWQEVKSCGRD